MECYGLGKSFSGVQATIEPMDAPRLPDLLSLIPEGNPRKVLQFALNDLGLSSDEIPRVLYDAQRLSEAVLTLLEGGKLASAGDRHD